MKKNCLKNIFKFEKTLEKISIKLLFLMVLLPSCREKINIKLDSSYTRLVVDARLSLDTMAHCVKLTQTVDFYDPQPPPCISNAIVSIECDGDICILEEDAVQKGHYYTPDTYFGIQGKTYTLKIGHVDIHGNGKYQDYSATSTMPFIADQIDSVKGVYGKQMLPNFGLSGDAKGWNILFYAQEVPSKDFYAFVLTINGEPYDDKIDRQMVLSDDFVQGKYINGLPVYFFPDNASDPLAQGDTIDLEIRSVPEKYAQYVVDVRSSVSPNNPMFGGTPANVRGNISNGAIGYFSTYANRRGRTILTR